jgi:DNA repair protein RadC
MTKCAYRIESKRIRETDFPYSSKQISSPAAVAEFSKSLEDADQEKQVVLFLNTKNKLIGISIQPGSINRAVIYPREIIKSALLCGAASIILVHNHPSGDPTPSQEDKALCQSIYNACALLDISCLDQIIIGEGGKYFSFTESRLLPQINTGTGQFAMRIGEGGYKA